MILLVKSNDFFVKIPQRPLGPRGLVLKAVKLVQMGLRELYTPYLSVVLFSFQSFRAVKLQARQGPSSSVKALLLNNMPLFDHEPEDEGKYCKERAAIRQRSLITVVEKRLVPFDEITKTVREVISPSKEERKLHPKRFEAATSREGESG